MTIYDSCLHPSCRFIEAYVLGGCSFKNIRHCGTETHRTNGEFRAKTLSWSDALLITIIQLLNALPYRFHFEGPSRICSDWIIVESGSHVALLS